MRVRFPWFDAFIRIVLVFFPVIDDWLSITNSTSSLIARQRFTCALWTHSSQRAHALARGMYRKNVQEHAHTMDMRNCTLGKKLLEWVQDSWKTVAGRPFKGGRSLILLYAKARGTLHCNWRLRCRMLSFWPVSLSRENRVLAATLCRKLFSHNPLPTSISFLLGLIALWAGAFFLGELPFVTSFFDFTFHLSHVPFCTWSKIRASLYVFLYYLDIDAIKYAKVPDPGKGPKFANSRGTLDGHVPVWYWPCDQAKHLFITPRQHQWNRTVEWILGGKIRDVKMYRGRKSYIYIYCVVASICCAEYVF